MMKRTNEKESPHMEAYNTLVYPLPSIKIDADRLLADLRNLDDELWTGQDRYYEPDGKHWKGIALYSVSGQANDLRAADRLPVYKTAAGEKCQYVCKEILPQFGAPCFRVALYRLKADTRILEHRDYGQNRWMGMVRIHVPVITNDRALMYVDRKPYHFDVGAAWYFDPSVLHKAENNGDQDRIHLIVDLKSCGGIEQLLKPLTLEDRLRFANHAVLFSLQCVKTALKYMCSPDGRARIRARLAVVFKGYGKAS